MGKKVFFGDDPLGKREKKSAPSAGGAGGKKSFGLNASAFIQRKMAEQKAKEDDKDQKK